jgi:hypothetical protein
MRRLPDPGAMECQRIATGKETRGAEKRDKREGVCVRIKNDLSQVKISASIQARMSAKLLMRVD